MNVAATLKALRLRAGLTQEELAARAGIDRSWFNQMERGKKTITRATREKLARALDVSPLELGGEEDESPQEHRSLVVRLEEVEAELDRRMGRFEETIQAIGARLAAIEAVLRIEEQSATPRQQRRA